LAAVPCSSKVEASYYLKTLAGGAAGVLVAACDVRACRFVEGSMRADKRLEYARSWLAELGMEEERITVVHLPPRSQASLEEALNEFRARVASFPVAPRVEAG
jgi:coenzyme F420-reducing hydrogenase delta subunit